MIFSQSRNPVATNPEKSIFQMTIGQSYPIPPRPVILIIFHSQHYFTVVFDYSNMTVYVFASRITQSGYFTNDIPWKDWKGPHLWCRVADLLGWDAGELDNIIVVARQWLQVIFSSFFSFFFFPTYNNIFRMGMIADPSQLLYSHHWYRKGFLWSLKRKISFGISNNTPSNTKSSENLEFLCVVTEFESKCWPQ